MERRAGAERRVRAARRAGRVQLVLTLEAHFPRRHEVSVGRPAALHPKRRWRGRAVRPDDRCARGERPDRRPAGGGRRRALPFRAGFRSPDRPVRSALKRTSQRSPAPPIIPDPRGHEPGARP